MKTYIRRREKNNHLVVLYGGWGTDENVFTPFCNDEFDFILFPSSDIGLHYTLFSLLIKLFRIPHLLKVCKDSLFFNESPDDPIDFRMRLISPKRTLDAPKERPPNPPRGT